LKLLNSLPKKFKKEDFEMVFKRVYSKTEKEMIDEFLNRN